MSEPAQVTQEAPVVLEVRGLVKEYPGVKALKGVDFDVREGEIHCLLGPNGAGKSTLIKCVSGAVEPTGGEILVNGEPLPAGDPAATLRRGVATIYQELDLVEDLSVAQSIFLAHEPRRGPLLDLEKMRRDSAALLTRLGHEGIDPRVRVSSLRPAAQQVVSIARALSHDVRMLIMDEPSAILDEGEIETLFGVVRRLTAEGVGVVYITHRLDEIRRIGDRVTVLTDGRTAATGIPATTTTDDLVELMVGSKVEQLYPERPTEFGDVLLEVRDMRGLPAVRGVSLKVHAGEVVGLGGLVGSGRSELLRLIYGMDQPDEGEVFVEGKRLPPNRPDRAIAAGLGLAPEDRKSQGLLLDWDLTKNVSLADLGRFSRVLLNVRAERDAAGEQLRALQTVPDDPDRIVRQLSGGNQQKVVLARWLLRHCRVLLLDEPTRGVDVKTKAELYRVIADLAKRRARGPRRLVRAGRACGDLQPHPGHARGRARGRGRGQGRERARASAPRRGTNRVNRSSGGSRMSAVAALRNRFGAMQFQEYALAIVVVLIFVVGAILEPDTFPTWDNIRNMLTQASVVGVIAIGMTFVIATGGIDLSVGSVLAAAGVFGGILVDPEGTTWLFMLGAIGFATFLGTINATSIGFGRVVPFIATLAMFSIAKGLALLLNDKQPVGLLDLNGGSFGEPAVGSLLWFGTGEILGIPVSVYVFLGVTIAGWIVLNRSRYGRHVVAVGGNREAARIAGVPVRRVIISVYVLSGFLVGIAAVLLCARLGSASPVSGNLYELDAIGAVVIGGTSLMGGRATIVGTFLGVLTFALIFSLMTQLNLSTEVQQVTKGAIVLGAVLIQRPEARL